MADIQNVIIKIKEKLENRTTPLLVALDGRSGVGKSTISESIAKEFNGVVVLGDNFYSGGEGGLERGWDKYSPEDKAERAIDWKRMRKEALEPLLNSKVALYHPFNFAAGVGFADTVITLNPAKVIILDGAYSTRPELTDIIDLTILVEVLDDHRRARLLEREGHEFMSEWHKRWDVAEDYFFTHIRPKSSFDIVITNP